MARVTLQEALGERHLRHSHREARAKRRRAAARRGRGEDRRPVRAA